FIPGRIEDNVIGNQKDPTYRGKLMAMTRVERERLLGGNWKVRAEGGSFFNRAEATMLDREPEDVVAVIRRWDLAASEPSEVNKDPDWTAGVKMGLRRDGRFVVLDAIMIQRRAEEVRKMVQRTAKNDGPLVKI